VSGGEEKCTFQNVARRANIERSTLYRRYPTRWAMMSDAFAAAYTDDLSFELTGSFRGDMICHLSRVAHTLSGTEVQSMLVMREGDALVSRAPGLACAVRSADCVPILLGDRRSGVVAAVHAGWRGAVNGIVSSAVDALRAIAPEPVLIAAIGPHISPAAFEVSEDVAETLLKASHDPYIVDRSGPKPHVDLRRMLRAELHANGLAHAAIDDVWGCTFLEPEHFFSFRRDGKASGRHLSAIVPRL